MRFRSIFCALALSLATIAFGQVTTDKNRTQLTSIKAPDAIQRALRVGPTDPSQVIHVTVSLNLADAAGLQQFADSVSDPTSPNYKQFLTPEEVGARFGLSQDKVDAVVGYLVSQGMKVNSVSPSRMVISADCTVGQAQTAFATKISDYQLQDPNEQGRLNFYSFSTPPYVPTSIASYIQGIAGLQNNSQPKARALTPTQTRTLYGLAPAYNSGFRGQGRTVAISNWDGFRLSNIPLYYAKYALPAPTGGIGSNIKVVAINGGSGSGPAQGEADLDIQMVLGMAPLCTLYVYDGSALSGASDLINVLSREASDNLADIVSESWGWRLTASEATSAHNVHLQMTAQGQTYMCASGDFGTNLEPFTYPNYDPEVLMVGGTVANVDVNGNRISEVGWGGSGGGWVTSIPVPFNTRPSWQKGPGVPTTINYRLQPDVALVAGGPAGAYFFYYNGNLTGNFSGTSFSSPVFAGSLAVTLQKAISSGGIPPNASGKYRLGRIQDLLYSLGGRTDVWYDVVAGNNGILPNGATSSAKVGWDFVTGWGALKWNAIKLSTTTKTTFSSSFMYANEGSVVPSPLSIGQLVGTKDGAYFSMLPTTNSAGQVASAAFRFQLPITLPRANVQQLDFNLTTKFSNGSTGQVYLFNWSTGTWNILRSYSNPSTPVSITATLRSYFTTYISAAGEYRVLVRGVMPASAGVTSNTVDTDLLTSSVLHPSS